MKFSEKKGGPAVRVVIVNPNDEIRALLRMKFSRDSRFRITGEFSNTRIAIQNIETTRPDAVVVDLSENLSGGLDLITLIKLGNPSCKVLVISGFPGDGLGPAAVRRGADAFIP
ncbi:MAG: response regulator, partial [Actinomycetota bacterium]